MKDNTYRTVNIEGMRFASAACQRKISLHRLNAGDLIHREDGSYRVVYRIGFITYLLKPVFRPGILPPPKKRGLDVLSVAAMVVAAFVLAAAVLEVRL